jgi:hypothetical protein
VLEDFLAAVREDFLEAAREDFLEAAREDFPVVHRQFLHPVPALVLEQLPLYPQLHQMLRPSPQGAVGIKTVG